MVHNGSEMIDYKPFNMSKVILSETHMKHWLLSESVKEKLKNKKIYIPTYFGYDLLDFCKNNFKELELSCIYYVEKTETEGLYNNHIWTPENDIKIEVKELKTNQLILLSEITVAKSDEAKMKSYIENIEKYHRQCIVFARVHQVPTNENKGHYFRDEVYLSWNKKPQNKMEKFSPSFKA